jgi:hypothetical protein
MRCAAGKRDAKLLRSPRKRIWRIRLVKLYCTFFLKSAQIRKLSGPASFFARLWQMKMVLPTLPIRHLRYLLMDLGKCRKDRALTVLVVQDTTLLRLRYVFVRPWNWVVSGQVVSGSLGTDVVTSVKNPSKQTDLRHLPRDGVLAGSMVGIRVANLYRCGGTRIRVDRDT